MYVHMHLMHGKRGTHTNSRQTLKHAGNLWDNIMELKSESIVVFSRILFSDVPELLADQYFAESLNYISNHFPITFLLSRNVVD